MSLLEDVFKVEGVGGPVALGLGALFLVPTILPAIGHALRPVAKGLIKTGMVAYDESRQAMSSAYESAGDLIAEARAERDGERQGSSHNQTERGASHPHRRRVNASSAERWEPGESSA